MASTQDHLPIRDIQGDTVILRDGSMAVILETSAVNFGLLSDNEQLAIISSFAGLLNSLSFTIQIVIRSKRLDITNYLRKLDSAQKTQTNPLLYKMIDRYRSFIREIVRENEVLDKQFFIVIPLSYLEIGLSKDTQARFKKALTLLLPRRDHIIRQLGRCGLRAKQLGASELVKLFYDIYNPVMRKPAAVESKEQAIAPVTVAPQTQQTLPSISPSQSIQNASNVPHITLPTSPAESQTMQPISQRRTPFVVEELQDEYHTV